MLRGTLVQLNEFLLPWVGHAVSGRFKLKLCSCCMPFLLYAEAAAEPRCSPAWCHAFGLGADRRLPDVSGPAGAQQHCVSFLGPADSAWVLQAASVRVHRGVSDQSSSHLYI